MLLHMSLKHIASVRIQVSEMASVDYIIVGRYIVANEERNVYLLA